MAAAAVASVKTKIHAATTREIVAASLEALRTQVQTEMGHQTYQTVMFALVGTGAYLSGGSVSKRAVCLGARKRARHDHSLRLAPKG